MRVAERKAWLALACQDDEERVLEVRPSRGDEEAEADDVEGAKGRTAVEEAAATRPHGEAVWESRPSWRPAWGSPPGEGTAPCGSLSTRGDKVADVCRGGLEEEPKGPEGPWAKSRGSGGIEEEEYEEKDARSPPPRGLPTAGDDGLGGV